jgi:5-dehydro-4-deoxyglucarate dehydratase
LAGLLSFPVTPFDGEGEVDLRVLHDHIRAQVDAGPTALFVACGTGELPALSPGEYRAVVGTAVAAAGGTLPVWAGAGGGPALAREFAAAAAEAGADGVLLFPPYLVTPPAEGIVRYVRWVAAAAPLPVIVYQRGVAVYRAPMLERLLDLPALVGLKDGIGDLDAMLRLVTLVRGTGRDFVFLNGLPTAETTVAAYRAIGVRGYSSAVHSFAPDIARAFYDALERGADALVQRLLAEFYLPLVELRDEVPGYAVALVKAGARLGGTPVGGVRPPLVDPTPEHVDRLADLLERGRAVVAATASRA